MGAYGALARFGQARLVVKIVLPVLFFALCCGLFAPRLSRKLWALMGVFILFMIAYIYVKPL